MDSNRLKAIIDLREYVDSLSHDRPPIGVFLKALKIDAKTMSDAVVTAALAVQVAQPQYTVDIVNDLFKLGVTIGYKYAISKTMEKEFGLDDEQPN